MTTRERLRSGCKLAGLVLAIAVAAPAGKAQVATPAQTVRMIEQAMDDLLRHGVDSQSPLFTEIRDHAASLKGLADSIRLKKEKNDELKARIKTLRDKAAADRPEMNRLTDLLDKEKAKLEEEMTRCLRAGDEHNSRNRVFKQPEEDAERAAYNAEAKRLDDWYKNIVDRGKSLAEGAEAAHLKSLMARADQIDEEVAELAGQIDNSISEDLRRFNESVEKIKNLIAEIAKPLEKNHAPGAAPKGEAWEQLKQVDEVGGSRFDTLVDTASAPSRGPTAAAPPPQVTGNANYQHMADEERALDAQIKDLKAKVFDPGASPEEVQASVKQMQELESKSLGLRFQIKLMESQTALPASAASRRSSSPPLPLPDIKHHP